MFFAHGMSFYQVERQKLKTEESSMRLSVERGRLDRSLNTAEQELQEAQQQILLLQVRRTHPAGFTPNTFIRVESCQFIISLLNSDSEGKNPEGKAGSSKGPACNMKIHLCHFHVRDTKDK